MSPRPFIGEQTVKYVIQTLQLSVERLSSMKKYVFGLGSAQVTSKFHNFIVGVMYARIFFVH